MPDLSNDDEVRSALSLCDFAPGDRVVIRDVLDHDHPSTRRLFDLGFLPGTEVLVVRRAPMRDPVVFELRGNRMALRRTEAARVLVVAVAGSAA